MAIAQETVELIIASRCSKYKTYATLGIFSQISAITLKIPLSKQVMRWSLFIKIADPYVDEGFHCHGSWFPRWNRYNEGWFENFPHTKEVLFQFPYRSC